MIDKKIKYMYRDHEHHNYLIISHLNSQGYLVLKGIIVNPII